MTLNVKVNPGESILLQYSLDKANVLWTSPT